MSGRVLFAKMPSARFEYMPQYGGKVTINEERVLEAVHTLANASGLIDTPRLRKAVQGWCDGKADVARRSSDDVLDTFRKRAAVIGFRCGVVFQLLECGGGVLRESKGSVEFALLMAEYALKYQTELFGKQLMEVASEVADVGYNSRNKRLFEQLPERFTIDMLREAKPDAKLSALREMVYSWRRSGLICPKERNCWEKVTVCQQGPSGT